MPDEAHIVDDALTEGAPLKVRCPKCKELINDGAVICTVCKSDLLPKVPCPVCRAPINEGAKICSTCKSDLSWKRHLSFSNTTLALLTALLAVAGTVGAQIKHFIWPPNSDVSAVWVNSTFQIPRQIELTVMNTGELAGTVVKASMFMRVPEESSWLKDVLQGKTKSPGFEEWWSSDLMVSRDKDDPRVFTAIRPLKFVGQQPPFTLEPGPAKRISLEYPYPESEEKPLPTGPTLPQSDLADCEVQISVIDARGRFESIRTLKTVCNLGSPWSTLGPASGPSGSR
jgi:predicted nucleic acid-binding Zn ribbon protein